MKTDSESCELSFFDIDNLPLNITKPFECVARDLKLRAKNHKI